MKRELERQFNHEVEIYRKALLYYAKKCDWQMFEAKAGKMFDYVESIEYQELERRFFNTFSIILGAVILTVVCCLNVDYAVHQEWLPMKSRLLFSAVAVCSFELYFYLDYRIYMNVKTRHYPKRREKFIHAIEKDFQTYSRQPETNRT